MISPSSLCRRAPDKKRTISTESRIAPWPSHIAELTAITVYTSCTYNMERNKLVNL